MTGQFEQKVICEILGVSQNTFTRWKVEGKWEEIANARKVGKERFADILMEQILALDEQLKEEKRKVFTSKEVNQLWQLNNMLTKTLEAGSTESIIQTFKQFTDWVRQRFPDKSAGMMELADQYILEQFKKEG